MKNIEFLFPEYTTMYAEKDNMLYLEKCNPKINIISTDNKSVPYFVKNKVDMIYIGSMPERCQEETIKKLIPYKKRIKDLINSGTIFLITGNAPEIFGKYIQDGKNKINALSIFNYYTIRDMNNRHNSHFIGKYNTINIVGSKHQFTTIYNNKNLFIKKTYGMGLNANDENEGIHYKNFYATQLVGPFLILNPFFTKELLKLLNLDDKLIYEQETIDAYNLRIEKLSNPDTNFFMGDHG